MQITQTFGTSELGARQVGAGRKFLEFLAAIPATLAVAHAWSSRRAARPADLKRAGFTADMQNRILAMKYVSME